jgi:hypothetical protein
MQISHALTIPVSVNRRLFQQVARIFVDGFEGVLVSRGLNSQKMGATVSVESTTANWRNGANYKAIPMYGTENEVQRLVQIAPGDAGATLGRCHF